MSDTTLSTMTEFYHARLLALDNWAGVEFAMMTQTDRVGAISRELGVSDLGAHSILAMVNHPLPDRQSIEAHLSSLGHLRRLVDSRRS